MKNTFAVTMTLLLALTLGGSFAGYRLATTEREKPSAAEPAATASAPAATDTTASSQSAQTANDSAPSPNASASGPAGPATAQGDTSAENQGGTQDGDNGAVIAAGSADGGQGTNTASATTPPGGAATGGETGQAPAETASAANTADANATAGDPAAGQTVFASNCAGCHGAEAKGGVGANLTTADGPRAWTDAQMVTALREGKTPQRELNAIMPRFTAAQVSDADIANIHAWLKSLN